LLLGQLFVFQHNPSVLIPLPCEATAFSV
jgi:hypothetical protein